jgi:ABC-type lipoprotein export system ATPase subunit
MLQANNLEYSYDSRTRLQFPDLDLQKDQHWLLLGQSGSGKTTLLHLLAGLMRPTHGHIFVDGVDMVRLPANKLDDFRGRHIGLVFQRPHFIRAISAEENLMVARQFAGLPPDKHRVHELLERLGIAYKAKSKPNRLSQGEQQRLAIARALINKPSLILADEPTSALDDTNCEEVINLLEEQAGQEKATLLVVTHDQRLKDRFPRQVHLQPQHL